MTCPDCGFIDIGIGNPPDNVCNDCAPRHRVDISLFIGVESQQSQEK